MFVSRLRLVHRRIARENLLSRPGPVKRYATRLRRFAVDPAYRAFVWLRLRPPANLFQPVNRTRLDRYPRIFATAYRILGDGTTLNLLSFGCSTGEELVTLRRYFPLARIKGIDINAHNLDMARRAMVDDETVDFALADSADGEPAAFYDAVFCMAVLRNSALSDGRAQSAEPHLHFTDFEKAVAGLARALKPGGLLAVRNSNFRFEDTTVAAGFEALLAVRRTPDTPKFGPDNRRLPDEKKELALFRKRS
jgi:SAM-dependent methyltransferase